jgi:hypothetical protein
LSLSPRKEDKFEIKSKSKNGNNIYETEPDEVDEVDKVDKIDEVDVLDELDVSAELHTVEDLAALAELFVSS